MIDRLGPTLLLTLLVVLFTALAAGPNASAALAVTFTGPTNYAVGADPDAIAVGDFDGDSEPDLAVANINSNTVSILLGAAGGSFTGPTNFPTRSAPRSVAVGDFNGDSDPDLAFANGGGNGSINLGAAGGSFTGPSDEIPTGFGPYSVAVGDFNGDSDPDLAFANNSGDNASILLGAAGASFTGPTNFSTGEHPISVAVGDFNGDSDPDLAFANNFNSNVSILLGAAGGSFTGPTNFSTGLNPRSVAVGDFNGDSDPDLAVANFGGFAGSGSGVSILLGAAGGGFTGPTDFSVDSHPVSVAVGDFNGDSDPDLAVANSNSDNVSILLGAAGGNFTGPTNFSVGAGPWAIVAGDFNADSHDDMAVANINSDNVSILLNTSNAYARPKGATPLRVPLVPAYRQCIFTNRTHGPPLASPSCASPLLESTQLTVGSPDANGQPANSSGFAKYDAIVGAPGGSDDSDVAFTFSLGDVRVQGSLADYTGQLQATTQVRITDRLNGPSVSEPATGIEIPLPVTVPCATTASTTIGSTCSITTTFDAVTPGAVAEGKRTIWALDAIEVRDGNNDPFMRQGVFVP